MARRKELRPADQMRLDALTEVIETLSGWGRSAREDARRCKRQGHLLADAKMHSLVARAFYRGAAYLRAEREDTKKKLSLRRLR